MNHLFLFLELNYKLFDGGAKIYYRNYITSSIPHHVTKYGLTKVEEYYVVGTNELNDFISRWYKRESQ